MGEFHPTRRKENNNTSHYTCCSQPWELRVFVPVSRFHCEQLLNRLTQFPGVTRDTLNFTQITNNQHQPSGTNTSGSKICVSATASSTKSLAASLSPADASARLTKQRVTSCRSCACAGMGPIHRHLFM